MNKNTRVGVIGTGYLGSLHAKTYKKIDNADLVFICDKKEDIAKDLSAELNVDFSTDFKDFPKDLDAVSIAVPTINHYEVAQFFLEKGIHVLLEKPITDKLETAEKLLLQAKKTKTILQVGHIERFNQAINAISDIVDKPLFIEVHRLSTYPFRNLEIGVVLDLMIHDIDIVLQLVKSDISRIEAVGVTVLSESEDIANARLKFDNNCICNLTASRISDERMRKIRIFQEDSYISLDYQKQAVEIYKKQDSKISKKTLPITKTEPLLEQLQSFIQTIQTNKTPVVSAAEATEALKIAKNIQGKIKKHNETISDRG